MRSTASFGRNFRRAGAGFQGTLANWVSAIVSDRVAKREKRRIADRSWDLYLNGPIVHGLVESFIVDVVGNGLTPQPRPMLRKLG